MQNDPKGDERGAKNKDFSILVFQFDPHFIRKKLKQVLKLKKLSFLLIDLHGREIRLLVFFERKGTGFSYIMTRRE